MKEQTTVPVDGDLGGATDAYGEGFPEPALLMEADAAQAEQEANQAENERQAMLGIITPMVLMGCQIIVSRMEGAQPVNEVEAQALSERLWAIAEHYDWTMSDTYALWFGLAATAGGIFAPRVMEARRYAEEKKRKEKGYAEQVAEDIANAGGEDTSSHRTEGFRQNNPTEANPSGRSGSESEPADIYP